MGRRAAARLALPLVRVGALRAGARRKLGARHREPPPNARQRLPLQGGAGVRPRHGGGPELRLRGGGPREHRAHSAHQAAPGRRAHGGAARRRVTRGAPRRGAARARARGARSGRGRLGAGRLPGLPGGGRRFGRGAARAGPHLLFRAPRARRLARVLRRRARRHLGAGPHIVPHRPLVDRRLRRAGGLRRAARSGGAVALARGVLDPARRGGGARRGRAAGGALPPLVLRPAQFPARQPAPALRHHRGLPRQTGRVRRPGRDLPAPRRPRPARAVHLSRERPTQR